MFACESQDKYNGPLCLKQCRACSPKRPVSKGDNTAVSEKLLWQWLRLAEKVAGEELHMERIENLVGVGGADVSGCYAGRYFDIELKTANRPARGGVILNPRDEYVRPSQKIWHTLRWDAGGSNFFLIQVGQKAGALRYLIPGRRCRDIEGMSEAQMTSASIVDPREGPFEFIRRASTYRSTCK